MKLLAAEVSRGPGGDLLISLLLDRVSAILEDNAVLDLWSPTGAAPWFVEIGSEDGSSERLLIEGISEETVEWLKAVPPFDGTDSVQGDYRKIGASYVLVAEIVHGHVRHGYAAKIVLQRSKE